MTTECTAVEYLAVVGSTEHLPSEMDASGERRPVTNITVEIPGLPCYELSPNARLHWRVILKAKQEAKARGVQSCLFVTERIAGSVTITWTVYLRKGGHKRDRDNLLPCLKPFQDSFVIAGLIDGDGPDVVVDTPLDQVSWSDHGCGPSIVAEIRSVRV